ncbi:aquaporin AQPAe.a-like [Liolophura sinensis]|uniref:aquaporin AQPAe.a-like n=1 Tax=Liolophura sinensis TaxID=3198878 RepID=UPI0031583B83
MPCPTKSRDYPSSACTVPSWSDIMAVIFDDLTKFHFWRAVIAEFLGTMFLIVVGVGACFVWHPHHAPTPTHIALHSGLYIAFIILATGHISGGLVNPALSIAFAATRRISVVRALLYTIAQCVGSVAGTALLKALVPESIQGDFGTLKLNKLVTEAQGFGIEFIITFVLLFGIFAVTDENRKDVGGSVPLTVGLIVTINIFFGMNYTGGGMNPARQFGPCVFSGKWEHHWIYWLGPISGGLTGALLYKYVFAMNASFQEAKGCITGSGSYDSVAVVENEDNNEDTSDLYPGNDKKKISMEIVSSI